jgi:hypothetical protein
MKNNKRGMQHAIIIIAAAALIGGITSFGQEEECYNFKDPLDCPAGNGAQPHGGCGNLNYGNPPQPCAPLEMNNYCDGTDYAGYCGSECGTDTEITGLKCNGTEQKDVPANYYVADFSCGSYDIIIPGAPFPIHVPCGPICSNNQPAQSTTLTITDTVTTQDGCPFHD